MQQRFSSLSCIPGRGLKGGRGGMHSLQCILQRQCLGRRLTRTAPTGGNPGIQPSRWHRRLGCGGEGRSISVARWRRAIVSIVELRTSTAFMSSHSGSGAGASTAPRAVRVQRDGARRMCQKCKRAQWHMRDHAPPGRADMAAAPRWWALIHAPAASDMSRNASTAISGDFSAGDLRLHLARRRWR